MTVAPRRNNRETSGRRQLCRNCLRPWAEHAANKCLFEHTTFLPGVLVTTYIVDDDGEATTTEHWG